MAAVELTPRPVAPARRAARVLVGAAGVSAIGDGLTMSAAALLAAAWSHRALAVATIATLALLSSGVSALVGGVYVDRWDRRRVLVVADVVRAITLGALGIAVVAGWRSLVLLAACTVIAEAAGGLFVGASQAIVPALVGADDRELERVNGRVAAAQIVVAEVIGQPLGGALFAVAPAVPFAADAASFVGSAVLLRQLPAAPPARHDANADADETADSAIRADSTRVAIRADSIGVAVRAGLRAIARDAVLRSLLVIGALTMFGSMIWTSVLVLIAEDRLHTSGVGFGLLLAATAIGAAVGSTVAVRVAGAIGTRATIMVGLVIEATTTLALAPIRSAWTAGALLIVNGFAGSLWPIVGLSLRQRRAPDALLGRVSGAHRACTLTAAALGGLVGGALAAAMGYGPTVALASVPLFAAVLVARRLPRAI